ncbi:unnamed protein product, partial [marine sediment metagenome]
HVNPGFRPVESVCPLGESAGNSRRIPDMKNARVCLTQL